MPAKANNYDSIAAYYDQLSMLVFGKSLRRAQQSMLSAIQPGDRILIVGGGAGWILEAIAGLHLQGLEITYIELSAKMIAQSKQRNVGSNTVAFINASILTEPLPTAHYDIVFTAFLFDNFGAADASGLFSKLHGALKPKGYWLFADFEIKHAQRYWQQPLLKLMYFFFKVCCNIQSQQLNDMESMFNAHGYTLLQQEKFYGDFVGASVYERE